MKLNPTSKMQRLLVFILQPFSKRLSKPTGLFRLTLNYFLSICQRTFFNFVRIFCTMQIYNQIFGIKNKITKYFVIHNHYK